MRMDQMTEIVHTMETSSTNTKQKIKEKEFV